MYYISIKEGRIKFMNYLYEEGVAYKEGTLIMPIYEDVYVMIK